MSVMTPSTIWIRDLRTQGKSYAEIAQITGLKRELIRKTASRLGMPEASVTPGLAAQQKDKIIALRKEGLSATQISAETGVSYSAVTTTLRLANMAPGREVWSKNAREVATNMFHSGDTIQDIAAVASNILSRTITQTMVLNMFDRHGVRRQREVVAELAPRTDPVERVARVKPHYPANRFTMFGPAAAARRANMVDNPA